MSLSLRELDAALVIAGIPADKAAGAVLDAIEMRCAARVPSELAGELLPFVLAGRSDDGSQVAVLLGQIKAEHWTVLQKTKHSNVMVTLARIATEEFKFSQQDARAWAQRRCK